MSSYKAPIRAHINAAIHAAFPPERIKSLLEHRELDFEVQQWLTFQVSLVPFSWERDWDAIAFKYAMAALNGEGRVLWEPRKTCVIYTGDATLCKSVSSESFLFSELFWYRCGSYATRQDRAQLRQRYAPEVVYTGLQGNGDYILKGGFLHRIFWSVHQPTPKPGPGLDTWDDWLGDRPF